MSSLGPPRDSSANSRLGDERVVAVTVPDIYLTGEAPDQGDCSAVDEVVAAVQRSKAGPFQSGPRWLHAETHLRTGCQIVVAAATVLRMPPALQAWPSHPDWHAVIPRMWMNV
jgi:hypothetical protein